MSPKILVVDDEPGIVDILKRYLKKHNYEVYGALSGKIALEMILDISPDLVITDLKMPEISGIDVVKKCCELNTKVLVVTASSRASTYISELNLLGYNIKDIMHKPIDFELFMETVANKLKDK